MSSPTTSSAAAVSSRLDRGAIAVITGGGSGFGLETARRCSAAGMKVGGPTASALPARVGTATMTCAAALPAQYTPA